MARNIKIAAAQLGPLHKSDSRAAAVSRMKKLLQDAHAMGAKFVVFPELAFTTFFPRWWMDDQAEVDRRYFERDMPGPGTRPLFDEAKKLGFNTPTENLHYPEPPALRVHHHLIMAQSMAFQNATWLVETAKCGFEDGFRMFGHSLIVAPTGEIAVKSQTEEDEVIVYNCDIDLAANLKKTMFNFAAHRRPEHFRLIVERVGAEVTPAQGP